ncbi:MAG: hypothetical protein HYR66_12130, partial [Sphingobacteriales bacterium]|nr:hypothetical protein [Sphingobacteriales bacterium]
MRKRFLLSVASLLILTNFIEAQIAKGSLLLGGGIGFNSTITKTGNTEEKQNGFFFSPALGTAIKQNVIAGGDILISHTEYASVTSEKRTYNSYGAGVFFRKYIPVANKFFIYGQGRL